MDQKLSVGIRHNDLVYPMHHTNLWLAEGCLPAPLRVLLGAYYISRESSIKKTLRMIPVELPAAWTVLVFDDSEKRVVLEEAYENRRDAFRRARYISEQVAADAFEFIAPPKKCFES